MSATTDTIAALNTVADWIDDLPGVDDATAMVHSAAIREAVGIMLKQGQVIAQLRAQINDMDDALHDTILCPKGVVPRSAEPFYRAIKNHGLS